MKPLGMAPITGALVAIYATQHVSPLSGKVTVIVMGAVLWGASAVITFVERRREKRRAEIIGICEALGAPTVLESHGGTHDRDTH